MLTRTVTCAPLLVFISAVSLLAQTGQITGLILDPAGTAVQGAAVAITNVATGVRTEVVTNDQGYYTALFLNPGDYVIRVQKQGFKVAEHP